ncbi:hypothetical protein L6452_21428 [Arctium lappa]|uniref:Uncharacterized protein n=1 Tax=Arctium lappa TaxID=4217 RepID=A0ACB9AXU5_ARCLA|nr:hypothetical protein L6452_21428 [Arctium lappa]
MSKERVYRARVTVEGRIGSGGEVSLETTTGQVAGGKRFGSLGVGRCNHFPTYLSSGIVTVLVFRLLEEKGLDLQAPVFRVLLLDGLMEPRFLTILAFIPHSLFPSACLCRSFLKVATTKEAVAPPLRDAQIENWNDRFTSEDHYEWLKDYSHFRHLIQQHITPTIRDYSLESALIIHAHCFSPNRYRLCEAIESNIKIWDLESKSIVVDLKVNMKQEFEMIAEGTTTQTNDRKTKAGLKEKALGPHTGGKSETWVNGESIGHYWPSYSVPNSYCADSCSYKGHMVGKMPRELQETEKWQLIDETIGEANAQRKAKKAKNLDVSGCNFQVESTKSSSLETYVLCVQPLLEKGIVDHSILHMTLVQYFTIVDKLFLLFNI